VHEERSEFADRVSDRSDSADAHESLRLAVDAAEIGTWNWHIPSGHVAWTPRTYQLFGFQPGALETSHALFLRQVHAEDRPAVTEWISRALIEHDRTALEFRIHRADGVVRWVRSTGRAMLDSRGEVVRMVGVVEDVSDEKQRASSPPPAAPAGRATDGSFSARQVAHILGVGEVTVKRVSDAGGMQCLRSSRKNSRRFAPEHVLDYLRRGTSSPVDFDSAARAQDMSACLVYLIERLLAGSRFEALLDERVERVARLAPPVFVAGLLARLPFIVSERRRHAFPALLAQAGEPELLQAELISCLLRAHGFEVLRPAGAPQPRQLADLVQRVRARFAVLTIGRGPAQLKAGGLAAAAEISAAGGATVCLQCDPGVRTPRGVVRFRSMAQLGSVLRGA